MKNIIFIAPPATGKGTLSAMLKDKYNYIHLSTGDLLRSEVESGSDLGQTINEKISVGELVSDEIITELLIKNLEKLTNQNFILDGYPRTTSQAQTLNKIFNDLNISDYIAIYLKIDKEEAKRRALGRITCSGCNKIYHLYTESMKPNQDNICDICGKELVQRSDDNEETFNKRFDTYLEKTAPILEYYQSLSKLVEVEVCNEKEQTLAKIEEILIEE